MSETPKMKNHLLTVLVEDYFHVGAFETLIQQRNWSNFEARYERNTFKTLDLLDETGTKGTFFILGWIARRSPELIKEIAARGHEVASRGFYHRSIRSLSPDEFREDLKRTNGYLEAATGRRVVGYRSAEKLRFGQDEWIFDILADEGFAYDASFVPSRKTKTNARAVHSVQTGKSAVWEFPYSTMNLGLGTLPISGGNYFRQIPYTLLRHAVSSWDRRQDQPFLFYFHVWELDPEQPRISAASRFNRLRHYRKLDKMEWIIRENLELYRFTDIAGFLGLKDSMTIDCAAPPSKSVVAVSGEHQVVPSRALTPISIVIPCYNEEETLPYLANTLQKVTSRLSRAGYDAEIVFVDDHSTDRTFETLHKLFDADERVRVVRHDTNRGVAAGIMTGLRAAKHEVVCSMDCDCTYDPNELVKMLPLLETDVDMVTASPYHRLGGVRNVPGWRLFLSRGASFLYRRTLRTKLSTYTSCFRVYRRSSLNRVNLQESGFLGVAEMLGRLDLQGGKIVEYPAVLDVRLFGISKMKTLRTVFGHLSLLKELGKARWFGKSESIEPYIPQASGAIAESGTMPPKN